MGGVAGEGGKPGAKDPTRTFGHQFTWGNGAFTWGNGIYVGERNIYVGERRQRSNPHVNFIYVGNAFPT